MRGASVGDSTRRKTTLRLYEKLKSLPEAEKYLQAEVSLARLDQLAFQLSDTESAKKMGVAKTKLLRGCKMESPVPPRFG